MDDFTVYGSSFDGCLNSLEKVLSLMLMRIRKRPHSPAPSALLPIGGCLSACAMPLVPSNGA